MLPRERTKVAVVGCSGYGDSYLESLLTDPRRQAIDLVAVADPAPQRCRRLDALRSAGVEIHRSIDDLLEHTPGLQLVMLATPTHLHARHACQAVDAGVDVLCEKPLAGSVTDGVRMLLASEPQYGDVSTPFIAVGFQWSFSPAIQRLKRDILSGNLGRPVRFKCFVSFPRGRAYYLRNDWAGRLRTATGEPVLDSPVNNATSHYLHNMLYLLGATRETSATPASVNAELYRANPIESFDTAALRVMTTSGVEVLFYTTHASDQRLGPVTRLEFENAVITHDAVSSSPLVARLSDGSTRHYGDPNTDRHEKIWQCVEAVRTRAAPACGVRASLPHTLITAALHDSCPHVMPFPDRLVETRPTQGDDAMFAVRDLHQTLQACFNADRLPSELEIPWASPGTQVPVPFTELLRPGAAINLPREAGPVPVRTTA